MLKWQFFVAPATGSVVRFNLCSFLCFWDEEECVKESFFVALRFYFLEFEAIIILKVFFSGLSPYHNFTLTYCLPVWSGFISSDCSDLAARRYACSCPSLVTQFFLTLVNISI